MTAAIYSHNGDEIFRNEIEPDATETSRHRAIRRGVGYGIRPDEHGLVRTGPGECDYYPDYDGGLDEWRSP